MAIYYRKNNTLIKETSTYRLKVGFIGKDAALPFIETRLSNGIPQFSKSSTFITEKTFKKAYQHAISILNQQAEILL